MGSLLIKTNTKTSFFKLLYEKKHLLFFVGIGIGLSSISSNRNEIGNFTKGKDPKTKAGRFDNKPFSWDVQTKQL